MALSNVTTRLIEIDDQEYVLEREVWEDGVYAVTILDLDDNIIAYTDGLIEDDYISTEELIRDAESDLIGLVS